MQTSAGHLALLHTRLSIIDLDSRSHQPFRIGDYYIVFNGEIYNYLELRQRCAREGVTFRTTSDTEVLLQVYLRYGEDFADRLEGQWAFCVWDARRQVLFLSRDRTGEKPLYYHRSSHAFFFASEVKAIRCLRDDVLAMNHRHLTRYLVHDYKALYKETETFFHNIEELAPATHMTVMEGGVCKKRRYWSLTYDPRDLTLEDAQDGLRDKLETSVRLCLRADVPVAFCLSGGVDSSGIASVAVKSLGKEISTFSIVDSDPRYNEEDNIDATVRDLQCRNTKVRVSPEGFWERMHRLVRYHDAPVATISYYVHSLLSEVIAQHGFKVAISGTGADELLSGYFDHFNLYLYEMRNEPGYEGYLKDWKKYIRPVVRNVHLQDPELYIAAPDYRKHVFMDRDVFVTYLTEPFAESFREQSYCQSVMRNRMLNELFHEVVPVILHEDDLNSMYYSIENRSPFLNHSLMEYASTIPTKHLIQDGYGKYVLRSTLKNVLNDQVRLDRQKRGFNASIQSLVNLQDEETRARILDQGPIYELLDRTKVEAALDGSFATNSFSKFLFRLISARAFMDEHATV